MGHDLIPWHHDMMLGDTRLTLSPSCHAKIEAEANYAAGRLLFLRDRFEDEIRDGPTTIKRVQGMAKGFGNTITTTLWCPNIQPICNHSRINRFSAVGGLGCQPLRWLNERALDSVSATSG